MGQEAGGTQHASAPRSRWEVGGQAWYKVGRPPTGGGGHKDGRVPVSSGYRPKSVDNFLPASSS